MNSALKLIIFGFALMIMGGIIFMTAAISKANMPTIFVLISYGFFVGFILIIIGILSYPNKKDND